VTGLVAVSHVQAHGSYTTYDLDVLFKHSILGRKGTTAATPEEHPAQRVRDSISIRVDPSQPDYAELPGRPVSSAGNFSVAAVFFVLLAVLTVTAVRSLVRHASSAPAGLPSLTVPRTGYSWRPVRHTAPTAVLPPFPPAPWPGQR
jgi:hypothetical protein